MTAAVQKLDLSATQAPSIPKVIVRAEPTLARILKTLDADYVKVQVRLVKHNCVQSVLVPI
jgi:mediator of RNA polymerase II transcription subunit 24